MIDKIIFKNFKIFKKEQTLELKPITILIGKNNTGKSAVLKLPTLIEGALKSKDNQPIQLVNDGVVMGNEYKDLVYGKFGRPLELQLFQKDKVSNKEDNLVVRIIIESSIDKPMLEYWKLNTEAEFERIDTGIYHNILDKIEYFCNFKGIYLNNYHNNENPKNTITVLIQEFKLNTDFIGGIREKAKKYYDYKPSKDGKSGIDGSNLYNFLKEDFLTTDKKYFNQIFNWIKEKFEGWELYVDADNEPYHIELRKDSLKINLSETGMGIGQSLPLIIRAFKPCEEETLIISEEPEGNLHPYAHAELAQLFADSLNMDANKKYLFETHSLNFVLRMRRLVAEGKLNKDNLAIYYVDFDEELNESNLKRILVDNGGGVNWWPEGLFSETSKETRAIYNAQLNDLGNVGRD